MRCPFCGNEDTKVIDTRSMEDNSAIRRRRMCEKCNERFTTYERVDTIPLTVIKADNTRESFDRNKILKGVMMSCNKRSVSVEQIEQLVTDIETQVMNTMRKEISSKELGEMVMERLKTLDDVAYVRFASVYRKFKDIDSFMKELSKILDDRKN